MGDYTSEDDLREHAAQVGLVCTQWAYLEWLLEVTNWWLLGLLNKPVEGRVLTSSLSIESSAKRVCDLCHLRISEPADKASLTKIKDRIVAVLEERNLAVHGLRAVQPDNTVTGRMARGKYKHQPQRLSLVRLRSLNAELASLIDDLEPLLVRYRIIEGTTASLKP